MAGNRMTKTEFVNTIADRTGLTKKQASTVLEQIGGLVVEQLKRSGEVTIPGLLKLSVSVKAAQPERQGTNPFTGQPTTFKAKPERKVVKARPVKALKDSV